MADRLNHPDYDPVVFKYVGDPEPFENYIDLVVETGSRPVSKRKIRLPRKLIKKRLIMLFPNDKEVSMPAFLCKSQGVK